MTQIGDNARKLAEDAAELEHEREVSSTITTDAERLADARAALHDWVDTVVLTALMYTKHGITGRRFVDCSENAMYWRFVWLAWLPIYLLIYWVPRWA